MIDIETIVFDHVYNAIHDLVPSGCVVSEFVPEAARLPFVTLVEVANMTRAQNQDNRLTENYAVIAFDANIYAITKSECRSIATALDSAMMELQFARVAPGMQYITNMSDPRIVRMQARYEAVTDGREIYRNT